MKLYYSPRNNGDGSVSLAWFLTAEAASADQNSLEEGWGEDCSGEIDSYEGSTQHVKAYVNEAAQRLRKSFKRGQVVFVNNEEKRIKEVHKDYITFKDGTFADFGDITLEPVDDI
jgi:hypothetical protein